MVLGQESVDEGRGACRETVEGVEGKRTEDEGEKGGRKEEGGGKGGEEEGLGRGLVTMTRGM